MDVEKEREAFEATSPFSIYLNKVKRDGNKYTPIYYKDLDYAQIMSFGWLAWQAAKTQAVPEGFAVAPIEITPKQIEAFMKGKVFPASMGEHRKFVERLSKDYTAMIEAQEQAYD